MKCIEEVTEILDLLYDNYLPIFDEIIHGVIEL